MSLVTQPHNYLPPLYRSYIHPVSTLYLLLYLPQLSCICPRITPPPLLLLPPPLSLSSVKPPPRLKAPTCINCTKSKKKEKEKNGRYRNYEWQHWLGFPPEICLIFLTANQQCTSIRPCCGACLNGVNGYRCQAFMDQSLTVCERIQIQWEHTAQTSCFGFQVVVDGNWVCEKLEGKWTCDAVE